MTELSKFIGPNRDVPAGDIGVGAREIGYMYGQYHRITSRNEGVLTGKGLNWGGSRIRTEATGYGLVYIADEILKRRDDTLKDKRVAVSGAGNVAQYALKKLIELGAKPITVSDSDGYVHEKDGIDEEGLKLIMKIKGDRGRIKEYAEQRDGAEYHEGEAPWGVECDIAMPCATQNEIKQEDAKKLVDNGCKAVFEGANMPSTNDAIQHFLDNDIIFGPAKACNAGGVATSGLEMTQNSMRVYWTDEEVDKKLKEIMTEIVDQMENACEEYNSKGNYAAGANIAGFIRVADSMLAQGVV
jgi:glutamate dehydrogenase (NADP+)